MRRPPLTGKVLDGLSHLAELARCWREADEDGGAADTLSAREKDEADAAADWIAKARVWHASRLASGGQP